MSPLHPGNHVHPWHSITLGITWVAKSICVAYFAKLQPCWVCVGISFFGANIFLMYMPPFPHSSISVLRLLPFYGDYKWSCHEPGCTRQLFDFIPYPETETPQVLKNFYTLKSSYILDTLYFPDRNPVHAADFLKWAARLSVSPRVYRPFLVSTTCPFSSWTLWFSS